MSELQASELQTFLANMRHAVFNRETVTIGGGEFSPEELRQVLNQIHRMTTTLREIDNRLKAALGE